MIYVCNNAKIPYMLHNCGKDNNTKFFYLYLFYYLLNFYLYPYYYYKLFKKLMDFIVETLKNLIPYFLLSIVFVFVLKSFLVTKVKSFDLAEIFFSFFRLYNYDEINMSSNKRRVTFMRWNNLFNYYTYFVIGLVILVYLVTKDA